MSIQACGQQRTIACDGQFVRSGRNFSKDSATGDIDVDHIERAVGRACRCPSGNESGLEISREAEGDGVEAPPELPLSEESTALVEPLDAPIFLVGVGGGRARLSSATRVDSCSTRIRQAVPRRTQTSVVAASLVGSARPPVSITANAFTQLTTTASGLSTSNRMGRNGPIRWLRTSWRRTIDARCSLWVMRRPFPATSVESR